VLSEALVNRLMSFELKSVQNSVKEKSLGKKIFERKSKCLLQQAL